MSPRSAPSWSKRESYLKSPDSWLDVLVLDHIEVPLVAVLARTTVTPTGVTVLSVLLRVGACVAFGQRELSVGASLYLIGLVLDGVDGKLARHLGRSSELGGRLDLSADYGLFAGLWITVGLAASVWTPLIWLGASTGVASAFVTTLNPQPRNKCSPAETRQMVASPGVLELHALTFGVAPFFGSTAIEGAMAIATLYFAVAWFTKLKR